MCAVYAGQTYYFSPVWNFHFKFLIKPVSVTYCVLPSKISREFDSCYEIHIVLTRDFSETFSRFIQIKLVLFVVAPILLKICEGVCLRFLFIPLFATPLWV